MPILGEVRKAQEVGYRGANGNKVCWAACPGCGKERWKSLDAQKVECKKCVKRGSRSHLWKGGRRTTGRGYIELAIYRGDFFFPMAIHQGKGILEHRLVMARSLGRCLHPWEEVHHKNGNRSDNRIENLELSSRGSHSLTHSKGYKDGFQQGLHDGRLVSIRKLETRIILLEEQLRAFQVQARKEIGEHEKG